MIEDIKTMVWKEFRELATMQGSLKGGLIRYGLTLGIMGIYLPMNFGRSFVEMPYFLFIYVWMTMFLGIGIVLDSFAGERERHTLETLLASRLSDRAMLYGKISAAVFYGFGMTLVLIVLGLATVNVAFWDGQIAMYPLDMFAFSTSGGVSHQRFLHRPGRAGVTTRPHGTAGQ